MNRPHFIYDNLLRSASSVTVSGAEQIGFEKEYACDWRDFTTYRPVASSSGVYSSYIEYVVSKDAIISCYLSWLEDSVPTNALVKIELEATPGGGFVSTLLIGGPGKQLACPAVNPDSDIFSSGVFVIKSGSKIRVSFSGFSGSNGVRQIFVGPSFLAQVGQWEGMMPTALTSGLVIENVISMNGSILSRNVRRLEKMMPLEFQYLTQQWVRTVWEPFAQSAVRYPFFFRWNPSEYPNDVVFAAATEVPAPKNSMPPGSMSVSLPIKVTV